MNFSNQPKRATGAIQTVNAQYSYAPEYSGFRKQVVAVATMKKCLNKKGVLSLRHLHLFRHLNNLE